MLEKASSEDLDSLRRTLHNEKKIFDKEGTIMSQQNPAGSPPEEEEKKKKKKKTTTTTTTTTTTEREESTSSNAFTKNPVLDELGGQPPRSDSPAIDISFAQGFDSHHHLTSVQEVYTNAAILDAAHQSMNFLDSKDFVDTEIRTSASLTISNFLNIGNNREGILGSGRGEESTSVGAPAGTSARDQIMERENETNEEVMKQFFEGHFFSGPTGLSDIGTNDSQRGGEEGTVANELVNLLHDWMEVPSVIADLLHPENGGGGTVKLSTSMGLSLIHI